MPLYSSSYSFTQSTKDTLQGCGERNSGGFSPCRKHIASFIHERKTKDARRIAVICLLFLSSVWKVAQSDRLKRRRAFNFLLLLFLALLGPTQTRGVMTPFFPRRNLAPPSICASNNYVTKIRGLPCFWVEYVAHKESERRQSRSWKQDKRRGKYISIDRFPFPPPSLSPLRLVMKFPLPLSIFLPFPGRCFSPLLQLAFLPPFVRFPFSSISVCSVRSPW